jgi:murein DD-endopeptidase MepM/ murein hydrolase activator NlpD
LEKAKARALALKSNASPKEVAAAVAKEPVSSSRIALTPEDKLIADSFKQGSLPWPVEKGFISLGYGDQAHPIYNTW